MSHVNVCRVYEICAAPLVESVLEGYNGTIFAYGQVCGCDRRKREIVNHNTTNFLLLIVTTYCFNEVDRFRKDAYNGGLL